GKIHKISGVGLRVPKTDVWKAKDIFQNGLFESAQRRARALPKDFKGKVPGGLLFGLDNAGLGKKSKTLFFAQMVVRGEFAFDVIYECADPTSRIDSEAIDAIASNRRKEFDARFEATFNLQEKGFSKEQIDMAREALSSLIGGIGYFSGSGLHSRTPKPEHGGTEEGGEEPELSLPYSLFATTPSRPFFPRGFLWDEGFHQLVLRQWDAGLSQEILRSWFATMDESGWIAREQILGDEARSKVPREFQVQYPNFANPPTLLFAVEAMAQQQLARGMSKALVDDLVVDEEEVGGTCDGGSDGCLDDLAVPFVARLLAFFQNTQAGDNTMGGGHQSRASSSVGYRWRGRSENHTLT
ncbi:Processing alpha glucosidase I, partial [Coemansia aciculifera]